MPSKLSILYVGPLLEGSTTLQRLDALKDAGHQLTSVNTEPGRRAIVNYPLWSRIRRRVTGPRDESNANHIILKMMRAQAFHVLWIDKGLTIYARTLISARQLQPECKVVGFSPDDMMNPANQSRHFLQGLPLYNYYITTKSYNVVELEGMGCPKVFFVDNSYDPHTHRPMMVSSAVRKRLGGPVGFIGQWEPERSHSIFELGRAGIPVRVWGYTWERMKEIPPILQLENTPLWGDEYAQAMCVFDINLCFLRKCNRDLQTTRTMEIPACGSFMLAERTPEHLRLFAEGVEAEFFSSNQELVEKCRYYLSHPEQRQQIAARGLERCLRDGYSYRARLSQVLQEIFKS